MKDLVKILALGFAGNLFAVPLKYFGWGDKILMLIAFPTFFLLTLAVFRHFRSRSAAFILAGLLLGLVLAATEVIVLSITHRLELLFLPRFSVHVLGIMSGYFYWKVNSLLRIVPGTLAGIFTLFLCLSGADLWTHYVAYGTFTGAVTPYRVAVDLDGVDQHDKKVSNNVLEGQVVLLDFWHTRCGVCFEKFPFLQAYFDKHRKDQNLQIFAVNKRLEEDTARGAFEVIGEKGYSFPVLLPTDADLPERFGVEGYPTALVLNRRGLIVYRGDLEGAMATADSILNEEQYRSNTRPTK